MSIVGHIASLRFGNNNVVAAITSDNHHKGQCLQVVTDD